MKKIFLLTLLISGWAWAKTCDYLSKIADDNGIPYGTKYSFTVQGTKGFRSYFHSAPSSECKLKGVFIIPNDSVIAYQEFKNEKQTWLYVMYIDKDGNDTSGWVKARDFKLSGRFSPVQ
jgi:hypothetical protein